MNKGIKSILFIVWLILLIFGTYAVFQRLTLGHKYAAYGSYVPWWGDVPCLGQRWTR